MGQAQTQLVEVPGGFPWSRIPATSRLTGMTRSSDLIAQRVSVDGMARCERAMGNAVHINGMGQAGFVVAFEKVSVNGMAKIGELHCMPSTRVSTHGMSSISTRINHSFADLVVLARQMAMMPPEPVVTVNTTTTVLHTDPAVAQATVVMQPQQQYDNLPQAQPVYALPVAQQQPPPQQQQEQPQRVRVQATQGAMSVAPPMQHHQHPDDAAEKAKAASGH